VWEKGNYFIKVCMGGICLASPAGRASERKYAKIFSAFRCETKDFRTKLGIKYLRMHLLALPPAKQIRFL